MKCPMCGGDFDSVAIKELSGGITPARRCSQCGGFWFEQETDGAFEINSVAKVDVPAPNYSLKSIDLVCPNDESLLHEVESAGLPAGAQYWRCPDCDGTFFPRGQLAFIANHQHREAGSHAPAALATRGRTALAVLLLVLLGIVGNAAVRVATSGENLGLSAATEQVLPTGGPSVLTLLLLGMTYLAGTVLAVLGRKGAIIALGWCVILVCLAGFSVVIFGP